MILYTGTRRQPSQQWNPLNRPKTVQTVPKLCTNKLTLFTIGNIYIYRFLKCQFYFSYICKKQQISENIETMMNISHSYSTILILLVLSVQCTRAHSLIPTPYSGHPQQQRFFPKEENLENWKTRKQLKQTGKLK